MVTTDGLDVTTVVPGLVVVTSGAEVVVSTMAVGLKS